MTQPSQSKLGSRQAERLFQLSCGYVICRSNPDPYKALRVKGFVEDSNRYFRGDVEYESERTGPRVTLAGMTALRAYVDRNGPLEFAVTPLAAHYKQVLRMEPQRLSEENQRLREALETIGTDCENFTEGSTCVSAGRERGARYLADAWCHGCIARDALCDLPTRREAM